MAKSLHNMTDAELFAEMRNRIAGSPAATAIDATATIKVDRPKPGDVGYVPKPREIVRVVVSPDRTKGQTFAPFVKLISRPIGSTATIPNRFNGVVGLSVADLAALHRWAKSAPEGQAWVKTGTLA